MDIFKLLIGVGFLSIIGYRGYQYGLVVKRLSKRDKMIFPVKADERETIMSDNQAVIREATMKEQKVGLLTMLFVFLFLMGMGIVMIFSDNNSVFSFILFLPILVHILRLLNQFVFMEDGLLAGARFVPWSKIKKFQFLTIDTNHKYYGYSREINNNYELKIHAGTLMPISYIITSEDTKEQIKEIFKKHDVEEQE